jgi:hypothetical protein
MGGELPMIDVASVFLGFLMALGLVCAAACGLVTYIDYRVRHGGWN